MVTLPATGGDTMWSNQYAAYEGLSAPMRHLLDDLTAIHDYQKVNAVAEHRVVRVHPETGRRCLYVNCRYTSRIAQLSRRESDALLDFLRIHSVQPHFTVRYRWSVGTVAVWDNRCTQHMVVNDFVGERVIQRVTFADNEPEQLTSPWDRFKPTKNTIAFRADVVAPVEA
jgi:taurine dioxygenase